MAFDIFADFVSSDDPISLLPTERSERALALRNGMMSQATGGAMDPATYKYLRAEFVGAPDTAALLPKFVKTSMDPGDFWQFIKYEFGTYAERRAYLRTQFQPLIQLLERGPAPGAATISEVLEKFDMDGVGSAWRKALSRVSDDPEGAITAARTLLETVCKHILDEGVEPGTKYVGGEDLPKLYALVSKQLGLAPSQHTESVFKQILGGCTGIVEGLGALRNRVGDAHGQGKRPVKPKERHATLAVNLAGTMSTFLVQTLADREA